MANSVVLFFLVSLLSSSTTAETIPKAVGILSDSGYQYMSLALYYAADSLSSKITIFAGQPSLDQLLPIRLRLHLLPFLLPTCYVVSVNGVSVIMLDMYQNDWLVVHGISEVLELPQHGESVCFSENVEACPSLKHSAF